MRRRLVDRETTIAYIMYSVAMTPTTATVSITMSTGYYLTRYKLCDGYNNYQSQYFEYSNIAG